MTTRLRRQRRMRAALALTVAIGLLGPLAIVFTQFWLAGRDELAAVEQERRGLAYLRPLTALLGHLTDAESVAARRAEVDAAELRGAIAAVDVADRQHGAALETGERWRTLRQRVANLADRPPAKAAAALSDYAETAQLAVDLIVKVGDTSGLVLEPQRDSYYLMDAVVRRLPEVVAGSGYLADLGQVLRRNEETKLVAARDRVVAASEATTTDLRRSLESTGRDTLGVALLGPADAFVASAGAIGSAAVLSSDAEAADEEELARLSSSLRSAAVQLQAAGLGELEVILADRHRDASGTRRWVAIVVLSGLLVAAAAAWFQLPRRDPSLSGAVEDDDEALPDPLEAGGRHVDRADGSPEAAEAPELIDARELLDSAELVRVGRAVRPARRGPADDEVAR
jgi:hypothetical protein